MVFTTRGVGEMELGDGGPAQTVSITMQYERKMICRRIWETTDSSGTIACVPVVRMCWSTMNMFVHQRVICNVSRVRSLMGRPGRAAHLRPSERVCRLDSGLHVCDQTKQGFKRASSEVKTGGRKTRWREVNQGVILSWRF